MEFGVIEYCFKNWSLLLWKAFWQFLMELDLHTPCDPAETVLGIYPRDR